MKVFIADDSLLVCVRLMSVLSKLNGLELVGYTRDAASTIESVSRLRPDIVILDIQMLGGSGIDVLQIVKRNQPGIIAIMLTNLSHPQYRKKCMDAGADFFFDKSTQFFEMAELFEQLAQRAQSLTSIGNAGALPNQAAQQL